MKTLTRTQFAAELGVAGSTITRWAQAGRLVFVDTKKIDVEASKRRLQATEDPAPHLAARRAQLAEARQARKTQNAGVGDHAGAENAATASAEAANGIDGLEIESIGLEMKRARLKTERYKAEQAQIEVEKLRGTLVERSNVDYTVESLARSV
ncbi:MAG TPA: hypothetical protein VFQ88_14145, partial [Nevskiaceae bacterium]|nr:hypothetical protein [Nevskiaceae bacterium]